MELVATVYISTFINRLSMYIYEIIHTERIDFEREATDNIGKCLVGDSINRIGYLQLVQEAVDNTDPEFAIMRQLAWRELLTITIFKPHLTANFFKDFAVWKNVCGECRHF